MQSVLFQTLTPQLLPITNLSSVISSLAGVIVGALFTFILTVGRDLWSNRFHAKASFRDGRIIEPANPNTISFYAIFDIINYSKKAVCVQSISIAVQDTEQKDLLAFLDPYVEMVCNGKDLSYSCFTVPPQQAVTVKAVLKIAPDENNKNLFATMDYTAKAYFKFVGRKKHIERCVDIPIKAIYPAVSERELFQFKSILEERKATRLE